MWLPMSEELETQKKLEVNIPGDGNMIVAHADSVSVSGPANVVLVGETIPTVEMVSFGDVQITIADSKLLEEFKADYGDVIKECVKIDFTVLGVNIELGDNITFLYQEKWDTKSLKFKKPELRKLIFDTIGVLSDLAGYLNDQYMRAIDTPRGYVLIVRNESWEQGCQLREVLRPKTNKLRYKLRDLYRELHPEEYVGLPPFEDHYEEE